MMIREGIDRGDHILSTVREVLRFFYTCTYGFLQRCDRLASQPFWRAER